MSVKNGHELTKSTSTDKRIDEFEQSSIAREDESLARITVFWNCSSKRDSVSGSALGKSADRS